MLQYQLINYIRHKAQGLKNALVVTDISKTNHVLHQAEI